MVKKAAYREILRYWCTHPDKVEILQVLPTPKGRLNVPEINNVDRNIISRSEPDLGQDDFWTRLLSMDNMPVLFIELHKHSPLEFCSSRDEDTHCINVRKLGSSTEEECYMRPTEASLYSNVGKRRLQFSFRLECTGSAEGHSFTFTSARSADVYFGDRLPPLYKRDYLHDLYRSWRLHRLFNNNQAVNPTRRPMLNDCYQKLTLQSRSSGEKEEIAPTCLLSKCNNWILFQGPAGVGKSTLFKHFAQSWSTRRPGENRIGQLLKDQFSWVICIQMYHLMEVERTHAHQNEETCLAILFSKSFMCLKENFHDNARFQEITEDEASGIIQHLSKKGYSVLCLLDGCDEVKNNPFGSQTGGKVFTALQRMGAFVLISSRFSSHLGASKYIGRFVEVEGLKPVARRKFIEQYAVEAYPEETDRSNQLHFCRTLQLSFRLNDRLEGLSTNPTLLEGICFVYVESMGEFFNSTTEDIRVTPIYTTTVDHLLEKCSNLYAVLPDDDCREEARKSLEIVASRLDESGGSSDKQVPLSILREVFQDSNIGCNLPQERRARLFESASEFFEGLGVLQVVSPTGDLDQTYEFIHRSYWEYFLALHKFHNTDRQEEILTEDQWRLYDRFMDFFVSMCSEKLSTNQLVHVLGHLYELLVTNDGQLSTKIQADGAQAPLLMETQREYGLVGAIGNLIDHLLHAGYGTSETATRVTDTNSILTGYSRFIELLLEVHPARLSESSTLLCEITETSEEKKSLLFAAGKVGSVRLVRWIQYQSDEWDAGTLNRIALAGAVAGGRFDCCRNLLNDLHWSNIHITAVDDFSWSPIYIASRGGYAQCLHLLLRRISASYTSQDIKEQSLKLATQSGHHCCVALLLIWCDGSIGDSDKQVLGEFWLLRNPAARVTEAKQHLDCFPELVQCLEENDWDKLYNLNDTGKDVSLHVSRPNNECSYSPVWIAVLLDRPNMILPLYTCNAVLDEVLSFRLVNQMFKEVAEVCSSVHVKEVDSWMEERMPTDEETQLTPYVLASCLGRTDCMEALQQTEMSFSHDTELSLHPIRGAMIFDQPKALENLLRQCEESSMDHLIHDYVKKCIRGESVACFLFLLKEERWRDALRRHTGYDIVEGLIDYLAHCCIKRDSAKCFLSLLSEEKWRDAMRQHKGYDTIEGLVDDLVSCCLKIDSANCFLFLLCEERWRIALYQHRECETLEGLNVHLFRCCLRNDSAGCLSALLKKKQWSGFIVASAGGADKALSEAVKFNAIHCLKVLESYCLDVVPGDEHRLTTEHAFLAAKYGLPCFVQELMTTLEVSPSLKTAADGYSLLFLAALNGHHELMEYFIREYQANEHERSNRGETIGFAAALGGECEMPGSITTRYYQETVPGETDLLRTLVTTRYLPKKL